MKNDFERYCTAKLKAEKKLKKKLKSFKKAYKAIEKQQNVYRNYPIDNNWPQNYNETRGK